MENILDDFIEEKKRLPIHIKLYLLGCNAVSISQLLESRYIRHDFSLIFNKIYHYVTPIFS